MQALPPVTTTKAPTKRKKLCRYRDRCTRPDCYFTHPRELVLVDKQAKNPSVATARKDSPVHQPSKVEQLSRPPEDPQQLDASAQDVALNTAEASGQSKKMEPQQVDVANTVKSNGERVSGSDHARGHPKPSSDHDKEKIPAASMSHPTTEKSAPAPEEQMSATRTNKQSGKVYYMFVLKIILWMLCYTWTYVILKDSIMMTWSPQIAFYTHFHSHNPPPWQIIAAAAKQKLQKLLLSQNQKRDIDP